MCDTTGIYFAVIAFFVFLSGLAHTELTLCFLSPSELFGGIGQEHGAAIPEEHDSD
jgi:hypothetical protein